MAELDTDRIAAAALAVADKYGVEGFTMRAVADALRVTPMALYHHVKDKAALAALVVDSAIRNHPLPPPTGNWQDDLFAVAAWTRNSTLMHSVVAHLRREYQVWTPSMLRITERWLGLWQQSGLDLERALLAATTSSMAITGLVAEETIFREMQLPDNATLSLLPNVRAMFRANHNRDANFELVVRSLIEGLHARLTIKRDKSAPVQYANTSRRTPDQQRRKRGNRSSSRK
ncbi:MAG TPA: TetR/AcrR family transcriptional regulator C-terminal domain-containing protein [Steroidobacteraceae bacterium]|nr:TetR/AcrR family transcriptional regulator C-terminal domain-containing protein [Steroidobacteraceae bacterium]